MVGGTNAANALLQIKATGQYDGLVFGNTYSQGAIGTNSQGALIYTGNAAPANLGGGLKHTHIWYSGSSGGGGPSEKMSLVSELNILDHMMLLVHTLLLPIIFHIQLK